MKRLLSVGAGLLLLATGTILVIQPGVLPPAAEPLVSLLDRQKRLALGALGAFVLLGAAMSGAGTRTRPSPVPDTDPETVSGDETPMLGASIDETVGYLVDDRDDARREQVYDDVRAVVIGHVQRTRGCDRETATEVVDDGEWTEDATVAAFLAEDLKGPWLPWLLDWLRYEPVFVRRLRRTLDEIERQRREDDE